MPRQPTIKGQGNLTRELLGSDKITIFEDARTRAGYSTQRPRVISAASRPKSPSKSPTKLSSSQPKPRSHSLTLPDETDPQDFRPKWKPQRIKGKTSNDYMRDPLNLQPWIPISTACPTAPTLAA
ncbi:hypothetical protein B0H10DRAFT_1963968 [Mycena sp. CBHHK59/15]|nr:hypothetical protein B0H10DRAFT_1963968 [Mycena sp. CBHHK59/15]